VKKSGKLITLNEEPGVMEGWPHRNDTSSILRFVPLWNAARGIIVLISIPDLQAGWTFRLRYWGRESWLVAFGRFEGFWNCTLDYDQPCPCCRQISAGIKTYFSGFGATKEEAMSEAIRQYDEYLTGRETSVPCQNENHPDHAGVTT
jgi:hypothetical protein